MTNELLYLIPSRGRPENIRRLAEAWKELSDFAEFLVLVDKDDPCLADYIVLDAEEIAKVRFGEPSRIGPLLNETVKDFWIYDAIGFMGDDHLPRTKSWDTILADQLDKQGGGIVYPNDLFQREKLPTSVVMSYSVIKALGYMVPPGLEHLYLDDAWKMIGESIDRCTYVEDVIVEHVHPAANKAEWDESYQFNNSPESFGLDKQRYNDWKTYEWPAKYDELRRVFG